MLKANEPVSVGEIGAAARDKRLTEEEAAEYLPGFYGESARKALEAIVEKQREWSRTMEDLGNSFREPLPASALRMPEDRQLAATRDVRAELAGIADVLKTSGEQIVTMASLAASTVAHLERVYKETSALRDALVQFKNQAATASGRLETLTRWLIAFTCAVVLLTVVLVVHDLTR